MVPGAMSKLNFGDCTAHPAKEITIEQERRKQAFFIQHFLAMAVNIVLWEEELSCTITGEGEVSCGLRVKELRVKDS
jgi:hypothetical protein